MRIESVEWSTYHLSPEDLIETWIVGEDIIAVLRAVIRVEAASDEDIKKIMGSMQR